MGSRAWLILIRSLNTHTTAFDRALEENRKQPIMWLKCWLKLTDKYIDLMFHQTDQLAQRQLSACHGVWKHNTSIINYPLIKKKSKTYPFLFLFSTGYCHIVIMSFYHNVLGTDVLMSILAVRKLYCSRTKSAPKVFVKKASENQ